jgi:NTP pyrophosphatase (non-canonical NTP hydrolase)
MYHVGYACRLSDGYKLCDITNCKYLKEEYGSRIKREDEIVVPNDYTLAALRTLDINLTTGQRLMEGLIGMNSEAGEALDFWKKAEFQGHKLDEKAIALELGDVLWYLVEAADALGYSLEEIMKMNIEKLKKRYPNGFDPEKSKNREG